VNASNKSGSAQSRRRTRLTSASQTQRLRTHVANLVASTTTHKNYRKFNGNIANIKYIYIYVYIYINGYGYIYICIYRYMYVSIYMLVASMIDETTCCKLNGGIACIHLYIYIVEYGYVIYMYTQIWMYICIRICVYIYTHICVYIYIHVYMYRKLSSKQDT